MHPIDPTRAFARAPVALPQARVHPRSTGWSC